VNFKPHLLAASMALATVTHATLADDYYGTDQPFASEAVYFIMTDRFVDGDSSNNYTNQGCNVNCTWNQQIPNRDAYIGYKGGDFKGILDNVNYLKDMGFSAIWVTPIFDNPKQAFTGNIGGADHNKTGYHGYWASNFYKEDEHLVSSNLSFTQFANTLERQHGIKVVLDIVANHASHGWDMTPQQYDTSEFGKVYDISGNKVCDHFNTPASQLGPNDCFFNLNDGKPGLGVPLAEFDQSKPFVVNYLDNAFLYWIGQGADAFRIDTVKHVPESYWKQMSTKIRAQYPHFYMFGEYFDSNMSTLSNFEKATDITVLDFAGKDAMKSVFSNPNSSFATLSGYLDTDFSTYRNPYELATFYDNHDMARLSASDNGFIDAHNWLFTARGIPVLYYGSEIGFQRGLAEHSGNRNYYGQTNVNNAPNNAIYQKLKEVVHLRQTNVALQKGLQLNVSLSGNTASFYRVYQKDGVNQTTLVLLNKGDSSAQFNVSQYLSNGTWVDAETGASLAVSGTLSTTVAAHDVRVFLFNSAVTDSSLIAELNRINDQKPMLGKNWPSAYLRGTHNNWTTSTPMTFKGNHIWEAIATFNPVSGQNMRWKIDLKGDWTQNYGDNSPTNGVLDATGADIVITTAGTYTITANDSTLRYTVTP
jgi:glycosidase